ncbi:MAG: tryptophan--tRNA ligase [Chloroflexi bacterium]|nr:MAG: tryptophan--tRNA ligase [Chloroflexota bacterium]
MSGERVFSGFRVTGEQHIGNYLGAIKNYVALQDSYECIYCAVDVHSLTTLEDARLVGPNSLQSATVMLAAGVDPARSIIFVQSHVPEVIELAEYFAMLTPLSVLTRVPTFKEKVQQQPENVNLGLVGYPVLMAADILTYKAALVPIGIDQEPHLELTREVARKFNNHFGDTFPEPKSVHTETPLIRGLDGQAKMSKSMGNAIPIAATEEETTRLVRSAMTDPQRQRRTDPGRPEVCNVYSLHEVFTPGRTAEIHQQCTTAAIGCVDCKGILADSINETFREFRARHAELNAKPDEVRAILRDGAARARVIAQETLAEVRDRIGLMPA